MRALITVGPAATLAAATIACVASALEGGYTAPSGSTADFDADGVMHVALSTGETFAEAYVVEGDTLTITSSVDAPHDCPDTEGIYTFEESDEGVTFTLVSDSCEARVGELTAGAWTKNETE